MSELRIPVAAGAACKFRSCKRIKTTEFALRAAAAVTCIVTLVVMVTDQQTKVISIPGFTGLSITKTAKYNLAKAFVYLISAAGIGAGYSTLVLLYSVFRDRPSGGTKKAWFIFVFDQVFALCILLAAASASAEVAYLGAHASADVSWLKICNIFGKFCNQLGASLISSFIATVAFVLTINISAFHLLRSTGNELDGHNPLKGLKAKDLSLRGGAKQKRCSAFCQHQRGHPT